ncbi:FSH1-domain-containing protein [Stereum hirsutum FP-91666 SS1]|uniref:FSH1-domain-containing protein n=1 Tax=Stereum hirsutum (strain FP-91666) TaxID=721885 RepID=UPI0004449D91|nr:FSH1-domain-containing protein [Stereum hirsutum FP-91666 SS1]EIM80761.1 FSH1-domain-containing protein [Stereum hirsutum FP-91666 SS1]
MSAPRRVLMLHGYTQNASIFSKRVAALRKSCSKDIEFVFVDAPVILYPVDLANTFSDPNNPDTTNSLAAYGSAEAADADKTDDPTLTPRAWWKTNWDRTSTDGLEESIEFLKGVLTKGPRFDGIFGFSQGAAMAVILATLLEKPETYPSFLVDGQPPHPPFSFCVSISGFVPPGPICASLLTPSAPYTTPTLHVMGKNDILVVEERSKALLEVSAKKRVEVHDGGHFVPSKANWRNFFKAYLKQAPADDEVPSPSPGPSDSAAVTSSGSGTVTPAL